MLLAVLDAPGNNDESMGKYSCQLCVSWPDRPGFLGRSEPTGYPQTNAGKIELIKSFAEGWSEPFRSLARHIPADTDVKQLDLYDYPPPKGLRSKGRAVLMGDSFHAMAMCKSGRAVETLCPSQFKLRFLPPLRSKQLCSLLPRRFVSNR